MANPDHSTPLFGFGSPQQPLAYRGDQTKTKTNMGTLNKKYDCCKMLK